MNRVSLGRLTVALQYKISVAGILADGILGSEFKMWREQGPEPSGRLTFLFLPDLPSTYSCCAHMRALVLVGKCAPCPEREAACLSSHKALFLIVLSLPGVSSLPSGPSLHPRWFLWV